MDGSVGSGRNVGTADKSTVTINLERVLESSKTEINELRRVNQRQSDRLSGFNDALSLLNASKPCRGMSHSEDAVGLIDQALRQIKGSQS